MMKYLTIMLVIFSNAALSQRAMFDDNYLNYSDVAQSTDADVQAFISVAGITDPTQIKALNRLVLDLKGVNNPNYFTVNMWSSFIAIYPMIGGTATSTKWNLKDPRDLDAAYRITWVNNPTFSANGVDFNGATGSGTDYGNTHFIPSAFAPSVLNNCALSFYSRDKVLDASISGRFTFSSVTDANSTIGITFNRSGLAAASDLGHDNQVANFAGVAAVGGLVTGSRITSTDNRAYLNGVQKAITTTAQTGILPADTLRIGTGITVALVNNVITRTLAGSSMQCAFASLSFGLTLIQQLALYNAVQQYETTLNRQVN